jgi:hypothetical protein
LQHVSGSTAVKRGLFGRELDELDPLFPSKVARVLAVGVIVPVLMDAEAF